MTTTTVSSAFVIGKSDRGRYPVTVDGVLAGHAWKWAAGHWDAHSVHHGRSGAGSHRTLAAAAQHLATIHANAPRALAREEQARTVPPAGWEFRSWDQIANGDTIRRPLHYMSSFKDDGSYYPSGWTDPFTATIQPISDGGSIHINGVPDPDGRLHNILISAPMAAIGCLVPVTVGE